jgi:hypothetical protein
VLTRSGVAKKLGKSIATVRRLEGQELFPLVDTNGVHRFPDDQVIQLLSKIRAGDKLTGARGQWLLRGRPPRLNRQPSRPVALTPSPNDALDHLRAVAQQEVAAVIVDLLDARQLRRLGPDLRSYLSSLLEEP